mgnify:CR=1 FL=1
MALLLLLSIMLFNFLQTHTHKIIKNLIDYETNTQKKQSQIVARKYHFCFQQKKNTLWLSNLMMIKFYFDSLNVHVIVLSRLFDGKMELEISWKTTHTSHKFAAEDLGGWCSMLMMMISWMMGKQSPFFRV